MGRNLLRADSFVQSFQVVVVSEVNGLGSRMVRVLEALSHASKVLLVKASSVSSLVFGFLPEIKPSYLG